MNLHVYGYIVLHFEVVHIQFLHDDKAKA